MQQATEKTRRVARDDAKKRDIIDAAARCFMERGYNATTIDQIADLCGSTKGLVYYHFRSKMDLFLEAYRQANRHTIDKAVPIRDRAAPADERLRQLCRAHLQDMVEHLAYHHVSKQGVSVQTASALTAAQYESLRELVAVRDEYENIFRSVLADGRADGTLRVADVGLTSRIVLGALNSVALWYKPRPAQGRQAFDAMVDSITDIIVAGLLPR